MRKSIIIPNMKKLATSMATIPQKLFQVTNSKGHKRGWSPFKNHHLWWRRWLRSYWFCSGYSCYNNKEPSPSHHQFDSWYVHHSQSFLWFMTLLYPQNLSNPAAVHTRAGSALASGAFGNSCMPSNSSISSMTNKSCRLLSSRKLPMTFFEANPAQLSRGI